MSPLLLHGNAIQYNINGLLCTYTEMFRLQTCCNYILSYQLQRGFGGRGQHARIQGCLSVLFSPQLFLQFTEGVQWFFLLKKLYLYFTKDPEGRGVKLFPGGGGPNANFFRNPCTYLLFSMGGGGFRTPYPPLDPHMGNVIIPGQYLSQSRF